MPEADTFAAVDVVIEDPRWDEAGITLLAETAVAATLRHLAPGATGFEVALLACDDARIAALNSSFRDKPTPTNVLSWPAEELAAAEPGAGPRRPSGPELGDIAIAFETCAREAAEYGRPLSDHATHLLVHGTLHLLGYDHIRPDDAALMERHEVEILATLGLPDPY